MKRILFDFPPLFIPPSRRLPQPSSIQNSDYSISINKLNDGQMIMLLKSFACSVNRTVDLTTCNTDSLLENKLPKQFGRKFCRHELQINARKVMRYDACKMPNHNFYRGIENFATQLRHHGFPLISYTSNFTGTATKGKTILFKVVKKDNLKVGVLGNSIQSEVLTTDKLYSSAKHFNIVSKANDTAAFLKNKQVCDRIILLSNHRYKYNKEEKICDKAMASGSQNTNQII